MVSFTSLIVTALTTSSAYALDCKQVGLVMEGYVGMGRSCQKTCADKAYYAVHAMANKGDPCIAGDGLSDVQGVQVTSEKPCTNPNCPALVECQCKFGFYAWRVRKLPCSTHLPVIPTYRSAKKKNPPYRMHFFNLMGKP
ncbi:Uncharacterized protein HZ326_28378 [Fusarium oxysporum f. sp. albedinis]|nr:Uncharacterized protein HZ326_28378 [Fusarium oxysporum f. sp. albedinis]